MEEKILFKVKTHKIIGVFRVVILLALVGCVVVCTMLYNNELHGLDWMYEHMHEPYCVQTFDDKLLFTEEDYLAVSGQYSSYHEFVEAEYAKLPDKEYHDQYIDCDILVYGSADAAIEQFYIEYDSPLEEFIFSLSICLLIILAAYLLLVLPVKSQRSKFVVTESAIRGKKGSKKFDVAFGDIIELTQKGKSITVKTEKKNLKLSSIKNCDEIYNYIRPFAPEKPVAQKVTSTVDDIKLF